MATNAAVGPDHTASWLQSSGAGMAVIGDIAVEVPDLETLRRYDIAGPRYTSYPTADRFIEAFDAEAYAAALGARKQAMAPPSLSLYVHLPFCDTICYYCACNKVITRNHDRAAEYLRFLEREADLVRRHLTGVRAVEQLHLGGGSPTFLSSHELEQLMELLAARFPLAERGEFSVEVDPRSAGREKIAALGRLGFNRLSLGVQDFDRAVQGAVNRHQSLALTKATVDAALEAGFASVNMDLIYGLPMQTRASFATTVEQVIALGPDRIALYRYAHLPDRFKPQRRIAISDLPSTEVSTGIMLDAIERLAASGYQLIGMDHFAKATDDLAVAQREGRLHRNFQGYSTRPDCDLIGLGVSAISKVGPSYSQNERQLDDYYDRVGSDLLPTARGIALTRDDLVRREVIMALMCHFEVSKAAISTAHLIDFDAYFEAELADLVQLESDGLVDVSPEWIVVTPRGRLLVRAAAMIFDRHLRAHRHAQRYSRIV